MSKWEDRKFYQAEKLAVLTIQEINWLVAKWVVDVYHQSRHSKLGCSPAEKYRSGMVDLPLFREHPEELIVPMMGLVIPRSLRKGGIRFAGLRWDSEKFGPLRAMLPDAADIPMRLDPLDISVIHVYDGRKKKWIEGQLIEPVEARGMTLNQWSTLAKLRRRIAEDEDITKEEALARAFREIDEFVQERVKGRTKSKAPKRLAHFRNRTAWSHMRSDRTSTDHSPPASHTPGMTLVKSPPIQPTAPFSEPRAPFGRESTDPRPSGSDKPRANGKEPKSAERKPQDRKLPDRKPPAAKPSELPQSRVAADATTGRSMAQSARQNLERSVKPRGKLGIRPATFGGRGERE